MNLDRYTPIENRFIVYSNKNENFSDRINGIVSSFLLALINDYHFRIDDSNLRLEDIFISEIEWNNKDWNTLNLRRGRLNLNSIAKETYWISEDTIGERFPNTQSIHIFLTENTIPYIFNNPKYSNKLKELDLELETAFSQLLTTLFQFNKKYQKNYNFLIDKLYEDGSSPMSVHIRTKNVNETTINYFIDAIKKNSYPNSKVFISSDDDNLIGYIKNTLPKIKIISLPYNNLLDNDYNNTEVDMVKFYYELFIQANCIKHIISHWSTYSQIISFLSADEPILVENKGGTNFSNTINGYRKGKLKELFEII